MIIIIGSGLAGYNLARELRALDKTSDITMITQDAGHFYSKPQLSTSLGNNKTAEDLMTMNAELMAEKFDIKILTHTQVTEIDTQNNQVHIEPNTSQGEANYLSYEKLVLALGADTPTPPMLGDKTAQQEIHYINDVYQYQNFRKTLKPEDHITVIGAGLVGCEFANDLSQTGHKIACIDPAPNALSLLVPKTISAPLQTAMKNHGVNWHLGQVVKSLDYANANKTKLKITLDNHQTFETDKVISAIGLRPKLSLAQQAKITTNKGITANQYLETNISNIYALGDCAEINGWFLPYVAPIMQAAKALATTLTGERTAMQFPPMPVNIKTTCYPIVICCPPNASKTSHWEFNQDPETQAIRAYFKNQDNETIGFILTNEAVKERMGLLKNMGNWL